MTYAEGVSGYGEQKAYRPTALGSTMVRIVPDKRLILAGN